MPSNKLVATETPKIPDFSLSESNLRNWLLNNSIRQHETLEETRKRMIQDGVSEKLAARCIYSEPTLSEKHVKETLKLCVNSKTGKFNDIPTLQNAGQLSEAEVESIKMEHNGQNPPYYYCTGIRRIYDNRITPHKEWITANFLFNGIAVGKREGTLTAEKNMKINISGTIGYHTAVSLNWDTVIDVDGEEKRVATFNERASNNDDMSNRIYEIPWSKQVFAEMMKHTRDGNVALGISTIRENKHYSCKEVSDILSDNIAEVIDQYSKPKPTMSFDTRDLHDFLKAKEKSQEQDEDHFQ